MADAFIKERAVIDRYHLEAGKSFAEQFSPVSLESIFLYVFAFAVWSVETLFDNHAADVSDRIAQLEPHTLRWYVRKAKLFMYGHKLVTDTDYYDLKDIAPEEIDKAQVVKYAVASEMGNVVYLKVAGQTEGKPSQLPDSHYAALKSYINEIKDAGVPIQILNEPADEIRINLIVYYDPSLMNGNGLLVDGSEPVRNAVQYVITNLPFNGAFRITDLLGAVKAIPAVEVVDIDHEGGGVVSKARNSDHFDPIVGFSRPYSGYYEITTLNVTYKEYKTV